MAPGWTPILRLLHRRVNKYPRPETIPFGGKVNVEGVTATIRIGGAKIVQQISILQSGLLHF